MGTPNSQMEDDTSFPQTLDGFGYTFNENGELQDKEGRPFQFVVRENDRKYNQKHYEALGKVLDEEIFKLLESDCGLQKIDIPIDRRDDEPSGFFFASEDYKSNEEKLLVIIHGSGVVRAGQWSRRLIINNNLEQGSQISYIKKAKELGYAVVVTNGNYNTVDTDECQRVPIRGSGTPEEHMEHIWNHYLSECQAQFIDVVAHSYGGVVTIYWLAKYPEAQKRVRKIAYTDSVHSISLQIADEEAQIWFRQRAINWVSSNKAVGKKVRSLNQYDVVCVSAGTPTHEETSWMSFQQIFDFFQSELNSGKFMETLQRKVEEKEAVDKKEKVEEGEKTEETEGETPMDVDPSAKEGEEGEGSSTSEVEKIVEAVCDSKNETESKGEENKDQKEEEGTVMKTEPNPEEEEKGEDSSITEAGKIDKAVCAENDSKRRKESKEDEQL